MAIFGINIMGSAPATTLWSPEEQREIKSCRENQKKGAEYAIRYLFEGGKRKKSEYFEIF